VPAPDLELSQPALATYLEEASCHEGHLPQVLLTPAHCCGDTVRRLPPTQLAGIRDQAQEELQVG
jgi:hypothetical protein